jgi:hypothetical protein
VNRISSNQPDIDYRQRVMMEKERRKKEEEEK